MHFLKSIKKKLFSGKKTEKNIPVSSPSVVIKVPVSKWKRAHTWGDYHMAVLLGEQLEQLGYQVLLQSVPEWNNDEGKQYDSAIVFRGKTPYTVNPKQVNIMWHISHPDDIPLDEYETYDKVFIASDYWSGKIKEKISTPVDTMLQCSDLNRFHPPSPVEKKEYHQQLLFVGNSRKIHRKILKDLLPTKYDLAVYGGHWKKLLPKQYIKGEYLANDVLYKHYGSTDILLNDHWDDMREKGFISNRIFDGLACGAFIMSDKVNEMGVLEEFVCTYDSPEELKQQIDYYMNHPEERHRIAEKGMAFVCEHHTFTQRAKQFSDSIQKLKPSKYSTNA